VISENHIELKFTASIELQEKIERLKGLLAHQDPNLSLGELFEKLCNLGLEPWNPGKPTKAEMPATSRQTAMQRFAAPRKRRVRPEANQTQRREHETESKVDLEPMSNNIEASLQSGGKSRDGGVLKGKISNPKRLSAEIVRAVWRRAGSRCENCGSSFALEIDHKIPRAKGGSSKTENLRLACRSCNQRAAIEALGQLAMDPYINQIQ
jgi:5-methylcytosine-specific restriction endonuclease McrA